MSEVSSDIQELKEKDYIVIPVERFLVAKNNKGRNFLYRWFFGMEYEVIGDFDAERLHDFNMRTPKKELFVTAERPEYKVIISIAFISMLLIVVGAMLAIFSAFSPILLWVGVGLVIVFTSIAMYVQVTDEQKFRKVYTSVVK